MAKSNTSKILKGTIIGVALGVAATMFLASKKGKEFKKDLAAVTADFYKNIAPKVKKIAKMGEKEYKTFMGNSAEQYAKTKKISKDMARQLKKDAQNSWKYFSKHFDK